MSATHVASPRAALASLVLALAAGGCTLVGGGAPAEVREYDLLVDGARAPSAAAAVTTRATIQVEPFGVSETLDREGIVWRRGEVEVGAYASHRWARPPEQAVREAVAGALRDAFGPEAVAADPASADPELNLRGYLARCEEVDRGERWFGVVELRVVLLRRDGSELLRRTYSGEEAARARNPLGVVEALRRAVLAIGRDLARDTAAARSSGPPQTDRQEPAR